jgi:sortase (surface protein transpeptidase)
MIGVGLTKTNNVDAPEGPRTSALWDLGFWYRGGAEPGQPGVLAVAGHVDRVGGAAAAFAPLHNLKPGDVVLVTDQRSGVAYRYRITEASSYSLKQVEDPALLDRIYGHDVAAGQPPSVPADLTARISVITCIGTWTGAQYDHRFVAFGDLIGTE